MSTPSRTAPKGLQPSPQKQAQLEAGFDSASQDYRNKIRQVVAQVSDLLSDPQESFQSRETGAFTVSDNLKKAIDAQGFDFDLVTGPVLPPPFIDRQELTQRLSRNVGPGNNNDNNGPAGDTWEDAYKKRGMTQGDGRTRESPIIVGAKNNASEPPTIYADIAPTADFDQNMMKGVQQVLYVHFLAIVFIGMRDRSNVFMRLHPWAATNWVNFFTGCLLGPSAIKKVNAILKAAGATNDMGHTVQNATRARYLMQNGQLSQIERSFYGVFNQVISRSFGNNAYSQYRHNHDLASLLILFNKMESQIINDPTCELAVSLRGQGKQGVSNREQLGKAFADELAMTPSTFWDTITRFEVLSLCAQTFSGGFLLFVDTEMVTLYRNNVKGCISELLPVVDQHFPQLHDIMNRVYNAIGKRLLTLDAKVIAELSKKQVETGAGAGDLLKRIEAL